MPRVKSSNRNVHRMLFVCAEGRARSGTMGRAALKACGATEDALERDWNHFLKRSMTVRNVKWLNNADFNATGVGVIVDLDRLRLSANKLRRSHAVALPREDFLTKKATLDELRKHPGFNEAAYLKAVQAHRDKGTIVIEDNAYRPVKVNKISVLRRVLQKAENG